MLGHGAGPTCRRAVISRRASLAVWREFIPHERRNSLRCYATDSDYAAVYVAVYTKTLVDEKKSGHSQGPLARSRRTRSSFGLRLSGSGLAKEALPEYAQACGILASPRGHDSRFTIHGSRFTVHGSRHSSLAHSVRSGCSDLRGSTRCSVTVRLTNDDSRRRQERSHKSSYWRRCIRWMMSRQSLNTLLMFSVSTAHVKCG